jgi:hypothetical protein
MTVVVVLAMMAGEHALTPEGRSVTILQQL